MYVEEATPNEGACVRYTMNRNRQMRGRLRLCEPESPNEEAYLRYMMIWIRLCLSRARSPYHASIVVSMGEGLPRFFKPCKLASKHVNASNPFIRASCLQWRGAARGFGQRKLASKYVSFLF